MIRLVQCLDVCLSLILSYHGINITSKSLVWGIICFYVWIFSNHLHFRLRNVVEDASMGFSCSPNIVVGGKKNLMRLVVKSVGIGHHLANQYHDMSWLSEPTN